MDLDSLTFSKVTHVQHRTLLGSFSEAAAGGGFVRTFPENNEDLWMVMRFHEFFHPLEIMSFFPPIRIHHIINIIVIIIIFFFLTLPFDVAFFPSNKRR